MVLYRHFVRSEDGAICELEESSPFTVDDYPLLEKWPSKARQFLGSEANSEIIEENDNLLPQGNEAELYLTSQEPIMRQVKDEGTSFFKSEVSFVEPQVVLVKNE